MSLETGREIHGRVVAELPITREVISRVEELGKQQDQIIPTTSLLRYEWRPGKPIASKDASKQIKLTGNDLITPEPFELPDPGPNPFTTTSIEEIPEPSNQTYKFKPDMQPTKENGSFEWKDQKLRREQDLRTHGNE